MMSRMKESAKDRNPKFISSGCHTQMIFTFVGEYLKPAAQCGNLQWIVSVGEGKGCAVL